jgi:hypothetical protein
MQTMSKDRVVVVEVIVANMALLSGEMEWLVKERVLSLRRIAQKGVQMAEEAPSAVSSQFVVCGSIGVRGSN